jgi:dipeptidyl aminopeptidase/acylaminoacyl peptidase
MADLPPAEEVPLGISAVPTGPREFSWRADAANTLCWAEARDGGDPKRPAEVRDVVSCLAAPFDAEPRVVAKTALRLDSVRWGSDRLALVSEWWWENRKTRTWVIDPSAPATEPVLLFDRSFEDRYSDPGAPVLRETPQGTRVLLTADGGRTIFLSGAGASPEGDRPFLDRLNLETRATARMFHSQPPHFELAAAVLDADRGVILTRRESATAPPNFFVRDLSAGIDRALTRFPHPQPQLLNVYKEQTRYERDDGVTLTGTLYLPPGTKPEHGPFPMLMWAYPQEFKSAAAAGQVTDSPHRFVRTSPSSPLLWLVHGYAVLDDPSPPIVGEGDAEPNDTYVTQLVAGAKAAVDEAVRRGVADRDRIAIGGHSYGAFMTANLLAHSDLFRAGIARSGAYNRTLTPFSFQAEERTFWQAPQVYMEMSPFTHAPTITEPILLVHGEADNNSGTFPMQSERFYASLKGLGGRARLVLLPHESHGYRARESLMHVAYETTRWLDKYVTTRPAPATPSTSTQP